MRSISAYTAGRLFAVVTKPISLFVANNFFAAETAQGLAVTFLASSLVLVGVSAGSHRRFYALHFDPGGRASGFAFYIYAASVVLLAGAGSLAVTAIQLTFSGSLMLVGASVIFFLSEKLADELLRLRIFERDFAGWGRASIARNSAQLAVLGILFLALGRTLPAWLAVCALSLGNFWIFLPMLPPSLRRCLDLSALDTVARLLKRAAVSLAANWMLWAIALLGETVSYLDRTVALVLDRALLPLFMLVVMCFSVVQMVIDFYYVSRHRRDFLERRITAIRALTSHAFLGSCLIGMLLSGLACLLVLSFSRNGGQFPLGYVAVIAIFQLSLATTAIPREIMYWSSVLRNILRIEFLFWTLFSASTLAGWILGIPVIAMFAIAAACVILRLGVYVTSAARVGSSAGAGPVPPLV